MIPDLVVAKASRLGGVTDAAADFGQKLMTELPFPIEIATEALLDF